MLKETTIKTIRELLETELDIATDSITMYHKDLPASRDDVDYWTKRLVEAVNAQRDFTVFIKHGADAQHNEAGNLTRVKDSDRALADIMLFRKWLNSLVGADRSDEQIDELYNESFKLQFHGRTIELPFDANCFNMVDSLLDSVIDEW